MIIIMIITIGNLILFHKRLHFMFTLLKVIANPRGVVTPFCVIWFVSTSNEFRVQGFAIWKKIIINSIFIYCYSLTVVDLFLYV